MLFRLKIHIILVVEGKTEGTCLFENTIIYKNNLYNTKNSQETVAKAKQSR